jgi:alkanesulfonate monooxygenase
MTLILSGYPHLEEAYWFGEGVLPEIRRREAAAASRSRPYLPVSA